MQKGRFRNKWGYHWCSVKIMWKLHKKESHVENLMRNLDWENSKPK